MNAIIAEIGQYMIKKNELLRIRQRARSKAGYYEKLFLAYGQPDSRLIQDEVRGLVKWNKPGNKNKLRILMKKYKIEQMQAEIQMHELVALSMKKINKLSKSINAIRLTSYDGAFWGIRIYNNDEEDEPIILELEQIQSLIIDEDLERIILRNNEQQEASTKV